MSDIEYHIGKLKLLPRLKFEPLDEQCKRIYLETHDYPTEEVEDWIDYLVYEDSYETYMVHNNDLYWIFDHSEVNDDDCSLNPLGNDMYEFRVGFYNGGTCLEECIGWELDKLEQNKKI